MRSGTRGQLVLLSAAILVVALVPLVAAYFQLGYHVDVRTAPLDSDPLADVERVLSRTAHDAAAPVPASFVWRRRGAAADRVRARLAPDLQAVNRSRLAAGTAVQVTYNATRAAAWARDRCPGGPDRQFGRCVATGGLVLQNRGGRTHVLAVAVDVAAFGEDASHRYTAVLEVWPGEGRRR